MGDRATVVFKGTYDKKEYYSPGIYLHWDGSKVMRWLKAARKRLRGHDQNYSSARFCGFCHTHLKGNLSLGLCVPPSETDVLDNFDTYSPGNHGVFVVDCDTFNVTQFDYDGIHDHGCLGPLPIDTYGER